jgi:hypothetical protein
MYMMYSKMAASSQKWPIPLKKGKYRRIGQLKIATLGRLFAKILRSLEQFIQTVKGQNNCW